MIQTLDIDIINDIAREAGSAIMEIYTRADREITTKSDNSPLTLADRKSNAIILEKLKAKYPDIPYISEETSQTPYAVRRQWDFFWLIDPLDGTKEFIKRNGEFTVNIALIERDNPVAGVVYLPAKNELYYAVRGEGAYKIDAEGTCRRITGGPHYSGLSKVRVVASRSHLTPEVEEFVNRLKQSGKEVEFTAAGSSLKICLVAEGAADVYPRFGPTSEWDTAAAHAVAVEAGRQVLDPRTRKPLTYNKENLLNPWFIVE